MASNSSRSKTSKPPMACTRCSRRWSTATVRSVASVYALGSLAASVLLAALLGVYLRTQDGAATVPSIPLKLVDVDTQTTSDAENAMPLAFFEVLDSPGSADVVNVSVDEIDLVMIFDEEFGI